MKRRNRYRYLLNSFSFGLLLMALYLNFLKKETTEATPVINTNSAVPTNDVSKNQTSSVQHPEHVIVLK